MPAAENTLKPLCDDIGIFGKRIKSVEKITGKIPRAMNDLSIDDAVEYISNGKITNILGDGFGARIVINNVNDIPKFLQRLAKAHKSGELKLTLVENYSGSGINPYINGTDMRRLNELGAGKNITLNKIKNSGYTRTNTDIFINGTKIEFQIGGKHTTRFGDVEHFIYDMRNTGNPDLSKLNDTQKELFYKMKKEYVKLINNKNANKIYGEYLKNVWKNLKEAEEKHLPFPNLPDPPAKIPKILSVNNLLKLETKNNTQL